MGNIRQHKTLTRSIILGGTILTGFGIWTLVAHAAVPQTAISAGTNAVSISNPNFSQNDTFLNQPPAQQQPALQPPTRLRTRGS